MSTYRVRVRNWDECEISGHWDGRRGHTRRRRRVNVRRRRADRVAVREGMRER